MPASALAFAGDITCYTEPERDDDWYPAAVEKEYFRSETRHRSDPLPLKETEFSHFQGLSEILDSYKAIERSRYIEQLRDDWNDEGAQGYTRLTWRRTAWFAAIQVKAARDAGVSIGVPTIAPSDQGSIDIHWQKSDRNLLINVPADPQKPATYYGASRSGETTSGLLDTDARRPDLLLWLTSGR